MCQPEDADRVLGVRRQRDVADQVREHDEQEQRADEREPLGGHLLAHRTARDLVAHQFVEQLDRGLDLVRSLMHTPSDVDHRHARRDRRQHQVQDRLVDREDPEVDPAFEFELVLRFVDFVARAVQAVDRAEHDDPADPHSSEDQKRSFRLALGLGGSPLRGVHRRPAPASLGGNPSLCALMTAALSRAPQRAPAGALHE